MSEDFKFYCLQPKNVMGIFKILVSFSMGIKFQNIFLTGNDALAIFFKLDSGSHWVFGKGGILL